MKERLKLTEVWFKLLLFLLFGLLFVLAIPYPAKSKQFPQLLAAFSLILIVISLLKDFLQRGKTAGAIADVDDTELKILDQTTGRTRRRRFYKAWGIILFSTLTGFLGGFLFTTFFLLFSFSLFFGEKKKLLKNTVVTFSLTIVIYFIFQWIFGIPLLKGIFWDIS